MMRRSRYVSCLHNTVVHSSIQILSMITHLGSFESLLGLQCPHVVYHAGKMVRGAEGAHQTQLPSAFAPRDRQRRQTYLLLSLLAVSISRPLSLSSTLVTSPRCP